MERKLNGIISIAGPQGKDGAPGFNLYGFEITNGHLFVVYAAEASGETFSIDANGHLIVEVA